MVERKVRTDTDTNKYLRFFPEERFQMLNLLYRKKIILRSLLFWKLVGKPPIYWNVRKNIVYKSKSMILLHVPDADCIKEIFKIAGLNAAEFVNRKHMYHCMCGKAEAILTSGPQKGRPVTFFIIGQNGKKKWEVQTYGNTEGVCHKLPEWNREERCYRCKDSTGYLLVQNGRHYCCDNFQVFNYSPIRI